MRHRSAQLCAFQRLKHRTITRSTEIARAIKIEMVPHGEEQRERGRTCLPSAAWRSHAPDSCSASLIRLQGSVRPISIRRIVATFHESLLSCNVYEMLASHLCYGEKRVTKNKKKKLTTNAFHVQMSRNHVGRG